MHAAPAPARPYPEPVEILGTAAPDDPAPRRGRTGEPAVVDLDLGAAAADGGGAVLDDEPPADHADPADASGSASPVGEALRAVTSPSALGLAALVVDLVGFSAGAPTAVWIDYGPQTDGSEPENPFSAFLRFLAVVATIGLLLGVAGLLRLPREPGAAGRALTGAAVLVSALLLLYTGVTMLRVGSVSSG